MANEKRLVWTDDVVANMCKRCNEEYPHEPCEPANCFMREALGRCKTVDAVEVVHSSWILNDDGSGTCKHCHRTTKSCWDFDSQMNYCPNCGATMDLE